MRRTTGLTSERNASILILYYFNLITTILNCFTSVYISLQRCVTTDNSTVQFIILFTNIVVCILLFNFGLPVCCALGGGWKVMMVRFS